MATHKFALIAAQSFNCLHHGWGVQQTSCHTYYMIYRPRYICVYVSFPNGLCKVSTANMMNVPRQQRVERAANNEKLPNTHQDQTTKNCYTHTQLHTRTAFTYVCRSAAYFWALLNIKFYEFVRTSFENRKTCKCCLFSPTLKCFGCV